MKDFLLLTRNYCSGEYDNVIDPQFGTALHQILKPWKPEVLWHKAAHSLGNGMPAIVKFIEACLK